MRLLFFLFILNSNLEALSLFEFDRAIKIANDYVEGCDKNCQGKLKDEEGESLKNFNDALNKLFEEINIDRYSKFTPATKVIYNEREVELREISLKNGEAYKLIVLRIFDELKLINAKVVTPLISSYLTSQISVNFP
jgi:hypothetical protein